MYTCMQGDFLPAADVDFHIDVDPTSGEEMVSVEEAKQIRRQGERLTALQLRCSCADCLSFYQVLLSCWTHGILVVTFLVFAMLVVSWPWGSPLTSAYLIALVCGRRLPGGAHCQVQHHRARPGSHPACCRCACPRAEGIAGVLSSLDACGRGCALM